MSQQMQQPQPGSGGEENGPGACEAPDEIDRSCAALLASLIGFDEVLYTHLDVVRGTATVFSGPHLTRDSDCEAALGRLGHLHPAVASYLEEGDERRPRRVSDVCSSSEWVNGPVYREVFSQSRSMHQLSLVTRLGGGVGVGWVLTRRKCDFSDDDVMVATRLLPHLTVLSTVVEGDRHRLGTHGGTLTTRETQVLNLLATGAPASAIARSLGITVSTARKHLEHIYDKLGVHDRLSAVIKADGTVPPHPTWEARTRS
jgi:DNA-binding CsgD family transcriptional regulator